MLGNIKQFEPLQTIYGEDMGRLSNVFFVLSGNCIILQALKMKVPILLNFILARLMDFSIKKKYPKTKQKFLKYGKMCQKILQILKSIPTRLI